jgi:hypothetical protein
MNRLHQLTAELKTAVEPYQGAIHGTSTESADVEFPTMVKAVEFITAYRLEDDAQIVSENPSGFNHVITITFSMLAFTMQRVVSGKWTVANAVNFSAQDAANLIDGTL